MPPVDLSALEPVIPYILGLVVGILGAIYAPYFADLVRNYRDKKLLATALYQELAYIYTVVSDNLLDRYLLQNQSWDDVTKRLTPDSKDGQRLEADFKNIKDDICDHNLYDYSRKEAAQLKLFYQLRSSIGMAEVYQNFFLTFESGEFPTALDKLKWLRSWTNQFYWRVIEDSLSLKALAKAARNLPFGSGMENDLMVMKKKKAERDKDCPLRERIFKRKLKKTSLTAYVSKDKVSITVTGKLSYCATFIRNGTITLQRSDDNKQWSNVTETASSYNSGEYAFRISEAKMGVNYYRTFYKGNVSYLGSVSNVVTVEVEQ